MAPQVFDSRAALRSAKARWTLAVGVLICIFGFTVYEPKFVGTWAELSSIFFWAFGLDLSLDAILRMRK